MDLVFSIHFYSAIVLFAIFLFLFLPRYDVVYESITGQTTAK